MDIVREIKFRAKDNVDNEWYYGDLLKAIDNDTTQCYFIVTDDYSSKATNIELNMCQSPKVISETIGQFTGLYDKNKVPIYEGDIVKINDEEIMYCRYNEGYGAFEFALSEKLLGHTVLELFKRYETQTLIFEVIGNIYDNPDLLGE